MLKLILPLVIAFFCGVEGAAQQPVEAAFAAGERLSYVVSYRARFFPNTELAEVTIHTVQDTLDDGRKTLHVVANGKVFPLFGWFFDLNDTYYSWLDPATLRPLQFRSEIREAGYRFSSRFDYDWDNMEVRTTYRNHKRENDSHKRMTLSPKSYDGIALFFNVRSADVETMVPDEPRPLRLVLEDTIRTINYRYLGRERIRVKGLGTVRTLKFSCQLATSTGESFEDGTEFHIWVSDDPNRVPVLVESPIKVGSIRARLSEWSGLKYPGQSVLKK